MKTKPLSFLAGAITLLALSASSLSAAAPSSINDMTKAAKTFLSALDKDAKTKASFAWDDKERLNWHFIPKDRNGLLLKDMNDAQRELANVLLASGMSYQGFNKALTIMSLEHVLWELENHAPKRDSGKYYFSIFGTPAKDATWGWRCEGHHLSLNFTIVKGKSVVATPSFYGSNPQRIKEGPRKGQVALAAEENMGRNLVNSLKGKIRKKAIIAEKAPKDILTGGGTIKVSPLENKGVTRAELNKDQQAKLDRLIKVYLGRHRPDIAQRDWKKAEEAGLDKIVFAWAGGTKPGDGHYYRVQGPTFLLEYDSTQNDANHVHAVYRDFDSDFGEDLLKKHYAKFPHGN